MNAQTPYNNLDPTLILDAIESVGLRCNGSLLALNSYENRVYQVGIEDEAPIIAKFYRPNRWSDAAILEEHQFSLELIKQEIPVVAPWQQENGETLHHFQDFRFALFPRWGGWALELDRNEQLTWMGRFIGRLHAIGATKSFQHRYKLDVQTHGYASYQFLLQNNFIPEHLRHNYCRVVETALEKINERFQQIENLAYIRTHGDMHPGNVLWNDAGPHVVDLDDCMSAPAMQDIWMLLSGNANDVRMQLNYILDGYEEFHEFDYRQLKLVEPLRILRMIYYSAWLARRWEDPAFPKNFPWFNTPSYWQEQLINLNEQVELLF